MIERDKNGNVRGCVSCIAKERANKKRKTHEEFIKELKNVNPNIIILSEYKTNNDKVKCKCAIDGYEWETKPHSLLQNHGCPECARKLQNRRNYNEFLTELKKIQPNIIPIGKFTSSKDKTLFKCKICGYEWETQAYIPLVRNGYGCPKCKNHAALTEQDIKNRLKENNPEIEYVKGFNGVLKHATFKCKTCGCEWETFVTSVLYGRGCPHCKISKGEKRIKIYLEKMGLKYEYQFAFLDCCNIKPLPFDFYLPEYNTCIEYDGVQHFEPTRFNKKMTIEEANDNFVQQKFRDGIKNSYCKNNNIKLLRIPYTEYDNIEKIINKYLS